MDIFLILMPPVAFMIAAALANIIKLKAHGVSSMFFYLLTPIFPFIIFILNLMIVLGSKNNDIRKVSTFKKTLLTLRVTLRRLPIYTEILCQAIKTTEDCQKKRRRMLKERYSRFTEEEFSGTARLAI